MAGYYLKLSSTHSLDQRLGFSCSILSNETGEVVAYLYDFSLAQRILSVLNVSEPDPLVVHLPVGRSVVVIPVEPDLPF